MRRQCQLLARRPYLEIAMLRGNVPTRIAKLDAGDFDAIVLAAAGLVRLGMVERITQQLPLQLSIPAVAQGVLAIEIRADDQPVRDVVRAAIHDAATEVHVAAERAFLARMGGSCQTPLAAHAITSRDSLPASSTAAGSAVVIATASELRVVGMCGMPDGTRVLHAEVSGPRAAAEALGVRLADELLARGAGEILAATQLTSPPPAAS
jgi:hydroxymethylbilane synthase